MATANVRFTSDTSDFQRGVRQINNSVNGIKTAIGALGGALAAIGIANVASSFARMGSDVIKSSSGMAASFETLQVQLQVLTGSAETAGSLVQKMSEYGAKTPFEQGAIQDAVKTLLTFGIATDDVMGVVAEIGDVSMGSADKLASLARVFGQVSSSGVMMGEDVNQLIDAGFNPLIEISRITGESVASLKAKASDGMLGINDLRGAFITATSEGGKYQGMLEKISNTTEGKMSNFKDNIDQLRITLGTGFNVGLNDILDKLNSLTPQFKSDVESVGKALGQIVSIFAQKLPGTLTEFKEMIADKNIWQAGLDIFKKGLREVLESPEIKEAFSGLSKALIPESISKTVEIANKGGLDTPEVGATRLALLLASFMPGPFGKIASGMTAYNLGESAITDINEQGTTGYNSAILAAAMIAANKFAGPAASNINPYMASIVAVATTFATASYKMEEAFGQNTALAESIYSIVTGEENPSIALAKLEREKTLKIAAEEAAYMPREETQYTPIIPFKGPIGVSIDEDRDSLKKAMDAAKGLVETPIDKYIRSANQEMAELAKTFGYISENVLPETRGTMIDSFLGILDFAKTTKPKKTEEIAGFEMQGFRGFQSEMAAVGGASFFTKGQTAENNLRVTNQYLAKIERNTKGLIKFEPSWT